MVSGCIGFLRDFALTFRPSLVETAAFVRKVSRIFQAGAVSTATCTESDSGTEKLSFSKPITRPEVCDGMWGIRMVLGDGARAVLRAPGAEPQSHIRRSRARDACLLPQGNGGSRAKGHGRDEQHVNPSSLSGYMGNSDVFDNAIVAFSMAYADQNEMDHAALERAVKKGTIPRHGSFSCCFSKCLQRSATAHPAEVCATQISRAPPQLVSLEVELHSLAIEREHSEHAIDARRVSVRHPIERPGWQLVPDARSEADLAQVEPPQTRHTGRILHGLVASPGRI